MRRVLAIGCCGLGLAVPAAARADGGPVPPVVGGAGVSAPGGPASYVAIATGGGTVVQRVRRADGAIRRSVFLRARLGVPGAALDGTTTGLSADGRTLVLTPVWGRGYPPQRTRLTLMDAARLRVRATIRLAGAFTVDAISPDGRWLYLLRYRSANDPLHYDVRVFDVRTRTLLAKPIVDPREPDEKMLGIPTTRTTSADGRWVYTLYQRPSGRPFIHALDTSGRTADCIDLPTVSPDSGDLGLQLRGPTLAITGTPGDRITVDTRTLAVHDTPVGIEPPVATAAAPRHRGAGGPPWVPLGLALAGVLAALSFALRRRRDAPEAVRTASPDAPGPATR